MSGSASVSLAAAGGDIPANSVGDKDEYGSKIGGMAVPMAVALARTGLLANSGALRLQTWFGSRAPFAVPPTCASCSKELFLVVQVGVASGR